MQVVTVRLPDVVKDELEQIAMENHRPLSNLCRIIILKWLEDYRVNKKIDYPIEFIYKD